MAGHTRWMKIRQRRTLTKLMQPVRGVEPAATTVQRVRYEGYGPGGAAVLIECLTADSTRTAAQLRRLFRGEGGQLGASGSIAYLFNEVGVLHYGREAVVPQLTSAALGAGAEDVVLDPDGSLEVLTDPFDFDAVRTVLIETGFVPLDAAIMWRAAGSIELDPRQGSSLLSLLEALERFDEVQGIYTNAAIPDEVLESV